MASNESADSFLPLRVKRGPLGDYIEPVDTEATVAIRKELWLRGDGNWRTKWICVSLKGHAKSENVKSLTCRVLEAPDGVAIGNPTGDELAVAHVAREIRDLTSSVQGRKKEYDIVIDIDRDVAPGLANKDPVPVLIELVFGMRAEGQEDIEVRRLLKVDVHVWPAGDSPEDHRQGAAPLFP